MTIVDIAETLGVSKSTVSRSISGKGRIGLATKERILAYIEQNDYRPNLLAKGLTQSKTYNICVVQPADCQDINLSFFHKYVMGISKYTAKINYDILIAFADSKDISQLKRIILNHKADGVILLQAHSEDASIKFLEKTATVFTTVGSKVEQGIIQVDNDYLSACNNLTTILLASGLERIALIGGNIEDMINKSRFKGYLEAHEQMRIHPAEDLIYLNRLDNVEISECVRAAIRKNADCIIAMDDLVCEMVLKTLKEDNIKIPENIKVASFYYSESWKNKVTSIKFDMEKLGQMACKNLFACLEGKASPEQIVLDYELMIKESTLVS